MRTFKQIWWHLVLIAAEVSQEERAGGRGGGEWGSAWLVDFCALVCVPWVYGQSSAGCSSSLLMAKLE